MYVLFPLLNLLCSSISFHSQTNNLFQLKTIVDAVYAIAHALHQNIKERCGVKPFNLCDELQPSPFGYELLSFIRNVSFVGLQGTQVIFVIA